ncbi:MAG: hypothetical protein UY85_C0030G0017 [Candidatus Peribacteria bacterium GW2011_GWB1_54_5]|nr:MAG: hypothetical protein UY85_C0030G0017 [Candidatus Peribacteria bacterium GW2011_GWB1_54_5]
MALEQLGVFLRECGAARCDDITHTDTMAGQQIEVAFDNDDLLHRTHGLLRVMEPIEHRGLAVEGPFRGVDILGIALAERAAAESNEFPLMVMNGKHDAVAEAVIYFPFLEILLNTEPRFHDLTLRKTLLEEMFVCLRERIRRIPQTELLHLVLGNTTLLEIFHCGRTLLEVPLVELLHRFKALP